MSMSEYELSMVREAKKGKKKALERLHDAFHKQLCGVIERELGDRSRSEAVLRAVFENLKTQVRTIDDPAQFEYLAIQLTIAECKKYPRSDKPSEDSGASQFSTYEMPKKTEEAEQPKQPESTGFTAAQSADPFRQEPEAPKPFLIVEEKSEPAAEEQAQNTAAPQPFVQTPVQQPVQPVQQPVQRPVQQPVQPVQQPVQTPAQQPVQPMQQPVQTPVQQPVQPIQQPVQRPVRQPVQPMQQPVQRPVQQPVQPMQQPVQRPVQQPVQPMQQPVQRPVQQPVQPMQQPVQRPMQQPVQRPVQQPAQRPVYQPVQRPVQQPVQPMQQPVQRPMQQPVQRPVQHAYQPVQRPVQPPVQQPAQQQVKPPFAAPVQQPVQPKAAEPIGSSEPEKVVAWLVCVNGFDRGRDYAIRNKVNLIGTSPDNDVRIHKEPTVASDNHASIRYDDKTDTCILQPGAAGKISINGETFESPQPLKLKDILTFGNAQFVYAHSSDGLDWKSEFGL